MTQQQKKKEDETPKKKKSTNPLMVAFKKDRNTPESLEKLRNDAALKSINKGRSNRGQKPLDKLPDALAKKSAARLKAKKTKTNPISKPTGTSKGTGITGKGTKGKGTTGTGKGTTGTGKGRGGSRNTVDKNPSTPKNPLWGEPPLW